MDHTDQPILSDESLIWLAELEQQLVTAICSKIEDF